MVLQRVFTITLKIWFALDILRVIIYSNLGILLFGDAEFAAMLSALPILHADHLL